MVDIEALKNWHPDFAHARFLLEEGKYICGGKMEKMSKSKYNVVEPEQVIAQYGADALRLYLMFLGPLEQSKPWDLSGIEGVCRFLKKVWRFVYQAKALSTTIDPSPKEEMVKIMHQTIKKVTESIKKCSFNTAISSLMIGLNSLSNLEKVPLSIIENFILLLHPFAPHIAAELWESIGQTSDISQVPFPIWHEDYLEEKSFEYPIAVNGKVRTKMVFQHDTLPTVIEKAAVANEVIQKWLAGQSPKNVVVVPNKMVNVVV